MFLDSQLGPRCKLVVSTVPSPVWDDSGLAPLQIAMTFEPSCDKYWRIRDKYCIVSVTSIVLIWIVLISYWLPGSSVDYRPSAGWCSAWRWGHNHLRNKHLSCKSFRPAWYEQFCHVYSKTFYDAACAISPVISITKSSAVCFWIHVVAEEMFPGALIPAFSSMEFLPRSLALLIIKTTRSWV